MKNVEKLMMYIWGTTPLDKELNQIIAFSPESIEASAFFDLVRRLRSDNLRFTPLNYENHYMIESDFSCGNLKIETNVKGLISRIEIVTLLGKKIETVDDLNDVLSKMGDNYGICFKLNSSISSFGDEVCAVASLQKILVAHETYRHIHNSDLAYDDTISVEKSDICFLGNSFIDVTNNNKSKYTIKEILNLMLIASNNTACDLMLKKLKEIPNTQGYIKEMQSNKKIFDETYKHDLSSVEWINGNDYFINLKLLCNYWFDISRYDWTPYDEIEGYNLNYIFKGGRSPGVFAGAWANRRGNKDVSLVCVINSKRKLTILDEITFTNACNQLLNSKGELLNDK